MRSLFVISLAISSLVGVVGCTRANPDAFTLPTYDLAQTSNGGGSSSGGGSGSGGGVAGSGGGGLVGEDLSVVQDLAVESHDMAESTEGIKCGAMTCSAASKDSCCVSSAGSMCIAPNATCGNGGVTLTCDGPEDCTTAPLGDTACCGSTSTSTTAKGATCGNPANPQCVPLCHTLADCGTFAGYVGCCPVVNTDYSRCSRTACK